MYLSAAWPTPMRPSRQNVLASLHLMPARLASSRCLSRFLSSSSSPHIDVLHHPSLRCAIVPNRRLFVANARTTICKLRADHTAIMSSPDQDYASFVSETMDDVPDNGLMLEGPPSGLEKIWDYETGGHHPVHLGDVLHQRYKVIHKLGSGGYANAWLCVDIAAETTRYVALKLIMAEGSSKECPELRVDELLKLGLGRESSANLFCLPLDQFEISGPNGLHFVFVYPVLGPRVSRLLNLAHVDDPGIVLRKISSQAAQAMATLHAHDICHGDFRPANILAHISGLDGLPEQKALELLGEPRTTAVVSVSGGKHELDTAPQYLVYPIEWSTVSAKSGAITVCDTACVIDFGESFNFTAPPPDLGIPQVYCSPEYSLEGRLGIGSDLWALGCTIFEIRTGRKLFDTFDNDVDEYLCKVTKILGKYPEPWWSATWTDRERYFEDDADDDGRVVLVSRLTGANASTDPSEPEHVVLYERPEPRSLQEAIAQGLYYEYGDRPGGIGEDIPQEEVNLLADLLARLLAYSPEQRESASEVLKHEWFKMGS